MKLHTKNGYDFFAVSSLLQKSLRRGDVVLASRALIELLPKYQTYCWNRLMTVSAEDCDALVTQEIVALHGAWREVQKSRKGTNGPPARLEGRIFYAKAIVLLAKCHHSRDQDELLHLITNRIPEEVFEAAMGEVEEVFHVDDGDFEIPEWVYDKHTQKGRRMGKTLEDFLHDEHDALVNSSTMFANFDEMVDTWGYVEPKLDYS